MPHYNSHLSIGVDACMFLYSWTQQVGFPVIKADFDRGNNRLTFKQEAFVKEQPIIMDEEERLFSRFLCRYGSQPARQATLVRAHFPAQ